MARRGDLVPTVPCNTAGPRARARARAPAPTTAPRSASRRVEQDGDGVPAVATVMVGPAFPGTTLPIQGDPAAAIEVVAATWGGVAAAVWQQCATPERTLDGANLRRGVGDEGCDVARRACFSHAFPLGNTVLGLRRWLRSVHIYFCQNTVFQIFIATNDTSQANQINK